MQFLGYLALLKSRVNPRSLLYPEKLGSLIPGLGYIVDVRYDFRRGDVLVAQFNECFVRLDYFIEFLVKRLLLYTVVSFETLLILIQ